MLSFNFWFVINNINLIKVDSFIFLNTKTWKLVCTTVPNSSSIFMFSGKKIYWEMNLSLSFLLFSSGHISFRFKSIQIFMLSVSFWRILKNSRWFGTKPLSAFKESLFKDKKQAKTINRNNKEIKMCVWTCEKGGLWEWRDKIYLYQKYFLFLSQLSFSFFSLLKTFFFISLY